MDPAIGFNNVSLVRHGSFVAAVFGVLSTEHLFEPTTSVIFFRRVVGRGRGREGEEERLGMRIYKCIFCFHEGTARIGTCMYILCLRGVASVCDCDVFPFWGVTAYPTQMPYSPREKLFCPALTTRRTLSPSYVLSAAMIPFVRSSCCGHENIRRRRRKLRKVQ